MAETQRFADRDVVARRYRYADGDVLAFDLGGGTTGAVDIVDGTLVAVVDDEQYEFDLPEGTGRASATMNNGVVTVDLEPAADAGATSDDPDADTDTDTEAEE
jgi:hypothetical protein